MNKRKESSPYVFSLIVPRSSFILSTMSLCLFFATRQSAHYHLVFPNRQNQIIEEGTRMFRKLIATAPTWYTVPLRLALGIIFFAHGAQKVLGLFGGHGLAAFTGGDAPFGFMRPAWLWLGAAAFAELIGGILVLAGLLTRVGAFLILCVMLTAMLGVHWSNGFFLPKGFEYTFALIGIALALIIAGGGQASVDKTMLSGRRR
jgi:putative oxidoreductase